MARPLLLWVWASVFTPHTRAKTFPVCSSNSQNQAKATDSAGSVSSHTSVQKRL